MHIVKKQSRDNYENLLLPLLSDELEKYTNSINNNYKTVNVEALSLSNNLLMTTEICLQVILYARRGRASALFPLIIVFSERGGVI